MCFFLIIKVIGVMESLGENKQKEQNKTFPYYPHFDIYHSICGVRKFF